MVHSEKSQLPVESKSSSELVKIDSPDSIHEKEAASFAENITRNGQITGSQNTMSGQIKGNPNPNNGMIAPAGVKEQINSAKGSGDKLPNSVKRMMKESSGELDDVRIHTDSKAAEVAKVLNAKAFTYGKDIFFGQGMFDTNTTEGKELIAHELTHAKINKEIGAQQIQRSPDTPEFLRTSQQNIVILEAFKAAFSGQLPKDLLNHYVFGEGTPKILTLKEMEDLHVEPTGLQGGTVNDIVSFKILKESIITGLPTFVNRTIMGIANTAGTLNRFSIDIMGTMKVDKDDSAVWSFTGKMRFRDEYDFDSGKDSKGEPSRSELGELQTQIGKILLGIPFKIYSPWVNVKQSNSDSFFDWFSGKDSNTIPSLVSPKMKNIMNKKESETDK